MSSLELPSSDIDRFYRLNHMPEMLMTIGFHVIEGNEYLWNERQSIVGVDSVMCVLELRGKVHNSIFKVILYADIPCDEEQKIKYLYQIFIEETYLLGLITYCETLSASMLLNHLVWHSALPEN